MKSCHVRLATRERLFVLVVGLFTLTTSAITRADGELDASFGTKGAVKITFPNASLGRLYDAAVVNGTIEAAGFATVSESVGCSTPSFPKLLVVRLSLSGQILSSPKSYPQSAIGCPMALAVDTHTGDIFVAGLATVIRFSNSGTVIAAGIAPSAPGRYRRDCNGRRMLIDDSSRAVVPCGARGEFGVPSLTLLRFSTVGDRLLAGGSPPKFSPVGTSPRYWIMNWNALARDDASGAYYVGGYASPAGYSSHFSYVTRHNATSLSLDTNYANGGISAPWSLPAGDVYSITLDSASNVLEGGPYASGATLNGYVARLSVTGTADPTFGSGGIVQNLPAPIIDLLADSDNRIYALSELKLLRLKGDGTPDTSFLSGTSVVTLNGPGSKWHGMHFVDNNRSSAYLFGGAGVSNAATTAIVAKLLLVTTSVGPRTTTTTSVSSSATTIKSGQPVTFTAMVTGTAPTGTVTFMDGSATLGSPVVVSGGTASYTTSTLAVGSHSITASYSGDSNNSPSTSTAVVATVDAAVTATATALTSSATMIASGQAVAFTATVTGAKPTGTVTFMDGLATLSSPVVVSAGTASYSTSTLAVGSHSIAATYGGDANNGASTSAAVMETVSAMPSSGGIPHSGGGGGGGGPIGLVDLFWMLCLALGRARSLSCCRRDS
jgi:hypothetical protein